MINFFGVNAALYNPNGKIYDILWQNDDSLESKLKNFTYIHYGDKIKCFIFFYSLLPNEVEKQGYDKIPLTKYVKTDKAIIFHIILDDNNFYHLGEAGRMQYLKETIISGLNLSRKIIAKKKLDTNIEKLISDVSKVLEVDPHTQILEERESKVDRTRQVVITFNTGIPSREENGTNLPKEIEDKIKAIIEKVGDEYYDGWDYDIKGEINLFFECPNLKIAKEKIEIFNKELQGMGMEVVLDKFRK